MAESSTPTFDTIVGSDETISSMRTHGQGPQGQLPFTDDMLRHAPSGDLFGMTQDAGMGWRPEDTNLDQYLILSTLGGSAPMTDIPSPWDTIRGIGKSAYWSKRRL